MCVTVAVRGLAVHKPMAHACVTSYRICELHIPWQLVGLPFLRTSILSIDRTTYYQGLPGMYVHGCMYRLTVVLFQVATSSGSMI